MLTTSKEPQHARFTSDKVMIKDHYYYKGNGFSWNKPARVNEKHYPFFHKQQDENKTRIENMKQQEIEDKKLYEEIRREKLIEKKAQTKSNHDQLIKEREVIQRMSNQPITGPSQNNLETEEDSKAVYEIVAKRLNSGKDLRSDEFSWNLLNKASKKNVGVYLGNFSLKGEEEMIRKLKERMEEENLQEVNEQRRKSEFHDKLRDSFITRHEKNLAKEEAILRPATAKTPSFQIRRSRVHHDNTQKTDNKRDLHASAAELKSHNPIVTPRSQHDRDTKLSLAVSVERLAVSRGGVKREFNIENSECKGMLVQNMDKKIWLPGNNFYDALTQNKVFQEILDTNKATVKKIDSSRKLAGSRPFSSMTNATIQSRPMTSIPKQSSPFGLYSPSINMHSGLMTPPSKNRVDARSMSVVVNDDYNTMQEINTFEHAFCRGGKKVGYARVSLEEAYRLTSSQGLVALQRMESQKNQQLVK